MGRGRGMRIFPLNNASSIMSLAALYSMGLYVLSFIVHGDDACVLSSAFATAEIIVSWTGAAHAHQNVLSHTTFMRIQSYHIDTEQEHSTRSMSTIAGQSEPADSKYVSYETCAICVSPAAGTPRRRAPPSHRRRS